MGARVNAGKVELVCSVAPEGRLHDCDVEAEHPRGQGFGRAAVASMRDARMVVSPGGPRPGHRVRATITFWNGRGQPPT